MFSATFTKFVNVVKCQLYIAIELLPVLIDIQRESFFDVLHLQFVEIDARYFIQALCVVELIASLLPSFTLLCLYFVKMLVSFLKKFDRFLVNKHIGGVY